MNGEDIPKVKVVHWWPGRVWRSCSPVPTIYTKEAMRRGSRYLTYAETLAQDGHLITAVAFCNPKDSPSREMGRRIAVGRLVSNLEESEA